MKKNSPWIYLGGCDTKFFCPPCRTWHTQFYGASGLFMLLRCLLSRLIITSLMKRFLVDVTLENFLRTLWLTLLCWSVQFICRELFLAVCNHLWECLACQVLCHPMHLARGCHLHQHPPCHTPPMPRSQPHPKLILIKFHGQFRRHRSSSLRPGKVDKLLSHRYIFRSLLIYDYIAVAKMLVPGGSKWN